VGKLTLSIGPAFKQEIMQPLKGNPGKREGRCCPGRRKGPRKRSAQGKKFSIREGGGTLDTGGLSQQTRRRRGGGRLGQKGRHHHQEKEVIKGTSKSQGGPANKKKKAGSRGHEP